MRYQPKKRQIVIIGATLGILCCMFGCAIIAGKYLSTTQAYNKHYPSEKSPIRTLSIEIDENQREQLFDQLRKVSERHNLEFHLSFYENGNVFFIEIYGKGLEILALSKPINITKLDIAFFEKDPADPPSRDIVDELYEDIRISVSEIPNVNIKEEK